MSLHSCANCIHFLPKGQIRCMIEGVEPVLDPKAGNRCKRFEFVNADRVTPARQQEAVFGGSGPGQMDPATARRRWEQLFGG